MFKNRHLNDILQHKGSSTKIVQESKQNTNSKNNTRCVGPFIKFILCFRSVTDVVEVYYCHLSHFTKSVCYVDVEYNDSTVANCSTWCYNFH